MATIIGGAATAVAAAPLELTSTGLFSGALMSLVSANTASKAIKTIVVKPTTATTTYKFSFKENATGYYFIRSGVTFTGTQVFTGEYVIISSAYVSEIWGASNNETFNIYVRYV